MRPVRMTLPAQADSVPRVRHAVVALAREAGAGERVVADVALAVSEACTNVVMHAYREAGEPGAMRVCAEVGDGGLLEVVVADEGPGLDGRPDSPGLGMGMALMAAVTTGLELDHDGQSTRVRLTFCLGGAEPGTSQDPPSTDGPADDSASSPVNRD
jgi:serine/threonine-protein kinase RsbW